MRAQLYQQKLQDKNSSSKSCDGSLNLQLSSLSSRNESEMEVVSSLSIHAAASSSPADPNSEIRNEKSGVSDYSEKDGSASSYLNTNTSHFEAGENINCDYDADLTTSDFHNGLSSSPLEKGNKELNCAEPEKIVQEPQFESSVCAEQNSQFKDYILGSINEKTLAFEDLSALKWRTFRAVMWEKKLSQQDSTWQRMFEANPKINLFPFCQEFFQKVKQNMNDEGFTSELFNHWLKKQKLKYPHRLAYQNINL